MASKAKWENDLSTATVAIMDLDYYVWHLGVGPQKTLPRMIHINLNDSTGKLFKLIAIFASTTAT